MSLEDELNGHNDIAQFLEKFKEQPFPQEPARPQAPAREEIPAVRPAQYARSFEKLEQKIHELEEKFEASTTQNQLILSELARTREVMERQKDKDAFLEHLSRTIATLRTSVENLSQTQQTQSFTFKEAPVQRSYDPLPAVFAPTDTGAGSAYAAEQEITQLRHQRDEQERLFNSLRQKASQLKAVNSALDREIKRTQQEKLEALKKSADQAKEILSLRDQLNAAEERFKAFNFEGRIISIKQEYQQKVTTLETQLKEMSDTCMKQVEELESLKAQNTKLQVAATQKEVLKAELADKEQQLQALKQTMSALQTQHADQHNKQSAAFTAQLRTLEEQRDRLAVQLEQSQISLETIRREKDSLEKNFKELVVKMNHNDAVIGQLKQKIEVLGQQNTSLAQHNEDLARTNTQLAQENQTLGQQNTTLTQHNEALSRTNTQLTQDNQTLGKQKAALTEHNADLSRTNMQLKQDNQSLGEQNTSLTRYNEDLSHANAQLKQDNESLSSANAELTQRSAALAQRNAALARQVKHLQAKTVALTAKEAALVQPLVPQPQKPTAEAPAAPKEEVVRPAAPVLPPSTVAPAQPVRQTSAALLAARVVEQYAEARAKKNTPILPTSTPQSSSKPTVLHSLGRKLAASPAEEEWEFISAPVTPKAAPTEQAKEKQKDLPEIKVADPVPQDDFLEGEDFLEKTSSFIGRMKWSIFRENR